MPGREPAESSRKGYFRDRFCEGAALDRSDCRNRIMTPQTSPGSFMAILCWKRAFRISGFSGSGGAP
jgi:hypothetical protein